MLIRDITHGYQPKCWIGERGNMRDRERVGPLNVLRDSMLRWWGQKFTREFSQVLRQSSGT